MSESSGRSDRPAPRTNWMSRNFTSTASRNLLAHQTHSRASYPPFDPSQASYWIRLPKPKKQPPT